MPHHTDLVLAIDDSPERYVELAIELNKHGLVLCCLQHPIGAELLIKSGRVLCILLDYDMPHVCPETGDVFTEWDGLYFAKEVLSRSTPVIITSANKIGAAKISLHLQGEGVPHIIYSVLNASQQWLPTILAISSRQPVPGTYMQGYQERMSDRGIFEV